MKLSDIKIEEGKEICVEKPSSDALVVISTEAQLVQFIVLHGDQKIKLDTRDSRTFIVPAFAKSRAEYCASKAKYCRQWGSN